MHAGARVYRDLVGHRPSAHRGDGRRGRTCSWPACRSRSRARPMTGGPPRRRLPPTSGRSTACWTPSGRSMRRDGRGGRPPRPPDQAAREPRPARDARRSSSPGSPGAPIHRWTQGVIVVAAADHGVTRQGVSAYPSDVTAQMVANFVAGGAAINVLGGWAGLRVVVVDAGVASPIPTLGADPHRGGRLVQARIRDGTADMTLGPAMTRGRGAARRRGRDRSRRRARRPAASISWGSARWGSATRRRRAPSARS